MKTPRGAEGEPDGRPGREPFNPEALDRTVIALPLLEAIRRREREQAADDRFELIIDVNLDFAQGRSGAQQCIVDQIEALLRPPPGSQAPRPADGAAQARRPKSERVHHGKTRLSNQYVFARLSIASIRELARRDYARGPNRVDRAIYKIWEDPVVTRFTNLSVSTVKADAAHAAFNAVGSGIVWAVLDTGVDAGHPHFARHGNLELAAPLQHRDFTGDDVGPEDDPEEAARRERSACVDANGHGTHVAGIIAGAFEATKARPIRAEVRRRDETGSTRSEPVAIERIGGMAPKCKILSLKVLEDDGAGRASNIIAALEYVQSRNSNGRRILIHGVNLSVGYDFEPKWFACGQSPLCVEVNRLVRSGVVVVVAAGNTGYGYNQPEAGGPASAGLDVTINDPGNADLAITVGSTHRDMPHLYGVSYFSSKGPTGDGRLKPDLLAPGEKIISCRSHQSSGAPGGACYREDSGTSMAAPHVSGVIAAFLSIRREFIGEPERVKRIFLQSAVDLGRAAYFQGKGLVDLMRAIQSV